ncbi:glycosyltransferase 87 family protein [Streptomyces sp. NPDC001380]|uniref:glycosyltransferase 87 family protein n=1 Tax=Streptomyces sp. NPDC001380 TaxID=3364566 RepID=UPI003696B715
MAETRAAVGRQDGGPDHPGPAGAAAADGGRSGGSPTGPRTPAPRTAAAARPGPADAGTPGADTPGAGPALPGPAGAVPPARARWYRPDRWPHDVAGLAGYWASSRLVMLGLVATGRVQQPVEVVDLYHRWYEGLLAGHFPVGDVSWQYPPGAALVMLGPGLLAPLGYLAGFVALSLAADAAVQGALLRAGRRPGRSRAGAWLWALGLPLLLDLPYIRYDVQVTAVAVAALLAQRRRPGLGGALAGVGAMVKVWPALTVLGTPRGRSTRDAWLALLASAAVLAAVAAVAFRGAFGFLTAQHRRGVEIESLGGSALQAARLLGWPGRVHTRYGSVEFQGPYVSLVAGVSLALTCAAFGWLLLWRLRARRWTAATPYDAALAAVLLFTVTSRVVSPQYLVWLVGLAAVCLTVRGTSQRPVAGLLLLATAATTLDYPLYFWRMTEGDGPAAGVVVVRNALLLAAALLSCVRLWRASRPREAGVGGAGAAAGAGVAGAAAGAGGPAEA